jgi:hypothetical protein
MAVKKKLALSLTCLGLSLLPGCFGTVGLNNVASNTCGMATQTPGGSPVNVSWAANRETAVNSTGGGYRVYYYQTSGQSLSCASFVQVPFVSGPTAPLSTSLSLPSGTWYVRVVGYSALNAPGNVGASSAPSSEVTVAVP